jgi:hypothetical protein
MPKVIYYRPLVGDGEVRLNLRTCVWRHVVVHQAGPVIEPGRVRTTYYRTRSGRLVRSILTFEPRPSKYPPWVLGLRPPQCHYRLDDDDRLVRYELDYGCGYYEIGEGIDDMKETFAEVTEAEVHAAGIRVPDDGRPADPRIIRPNAARDEWLYRQYCDHPEKTLGAIGRDAKEKGWNLGSDQAVLAAVKSHCKAQRIDMPRRKYTRTKKDSTRPR